MRLFTDKELQTIARLQEHVKEVIELSEQGEDDIVEEKLDTLLRALIETDHELFGRKK